MTKTGDVVSVAVDVRGVVQGVGFRPFVFRLAREHRLTGWVRNTPGGVAMHVEGSAADCDAFLSAMVASPPPAAFIASVSKTVVAPESATEFVIVESTLDGDPRHASPVAHIAPDLGVCLECVAELRDRCDRRAAYPYINCTNCGPRWSIITDLPYDRTRTTMAAWPMDAKCAAEYANPESRRFHAEPSACPECGPGFRLERDDGVVTGNVEAVAAAAGLLVDGAIVAVKGLGGYHLMCNANDAHAVRTLRERKFRKEKPFALLVPNLDAAEQLVELTDALRGMLVSAARPIVLAPARRAIEGVAPGSSELGIMLPSTPLQLMLLDAGAPPVLVCTSANRSSEPIAYLDDDARERLTGLADAFLVGARPIVRRVDDSVVRDTVAGPMVLRRSRGLAPGAVARLPAGRPILALGGDLKNSITLVVDGHAFVSQHLGDLEEWQSYSAFTQATRDLLAMYRVDLAECMVVADAHPQYRGRKFAESLEAHSLTLIQHHRAHIASVIAETGYSERQVVGIAFDGTGLGDDGTIWGGEFFVGSLSSELNRKGHLRPAALVGGDAAVRLPAQGAVGFLASVNHGADLTKAPFHLPRQFQEADQLLARNMRTVSTTSVGRLFDTVAALVGFTGSVSYEGQAAIWLEELARTAAGSTDALSDEYDMPIVGGEIDYRPLLAAVVRNRLQGVNPARIALRFHNALADSSIALGAQLASEAGLTTVVLSGGVFQNQLLLSRMHTGLSRLGLDVWTNHLVPPNDGGISLGQAALAAVAISTSDSVKIAADAPDHLILPDERVGKP